MEKLAEIKNNQNQLCYEVFIGEMGFTLYQHRTNIILTEEQLVKMSKLMLTEATKLSGVHMYDIKKKKGKLVEVADGVETDDDGAMVQ